MTAGAYVSLLLARMGWHDPGTFILLAFVCFAAGFFVPRPGIMLAVSGVSAVMLGMFGESLVGQPPCAPGASCPGYIPVLMVLFTLFWTTLPAGVGAGTRRVLRRWRQQAP